MTETAIRIMTAADLALALDWAAREGWNPGLCDAGPFRAADAAHFGAPRRPFLEGWLTAPGHVALLWQGDGGGIAGLGVVRPCRTGFKIGPLFADTPQIAAALLAALSSSCGAGAPLVLDVPEPNGAARALAAGARLLPVFETARMYRGPAPALPLERIFGITSFELG